MHQLDALRLASDQKANDTQVHQRHLIQIENERQAVPPDLHLQLIEVHRLDATDEPQHYGLPVGRRFDFHGHVKNSLKLDLL